MFKGSEFNGDLSNWDVSSVVNMSEMFGSKSHDYNTISTSKFNGNIYNWNVSSVTNMSGMFKDSSFNGDIANWNVSSVTNMSSMFYSAKFNGDLCNWLPSKTINTGNMFSNSPLEIYEISAKYIGRGTLCIIDFSDADNEIYTLSNQSLQNKEWKKYYAKLISDDWWYMQYKTRSLWASPSDKMGAAWLNNFNYFRDMLINMRNNKFSKKSACDKLPEFNLVGGLSPWAMHNNYNRDKIALENYRKFSAICKHR